MHAYYSVKNAKSRDVSVFSQYEEFHLDAVPDNIILEFRPSFIRNISGVYLLVAGPDPFADIYSSVTFRHVKRIHADSRVISAVGGRHLAFVGTVAK